MSFTSLLINTCDIQRNTPGALDDYGHPAPSWADLLTGQACRIMPVKGEEIVIDAQVVVADYKLFIGDVSITEQDRVVSGGVTYEVLLVKIRQDSITGHHKECMMRTVR